MQKPWIFGLVLVLVLGPFSFSQQPSGDAAPMVFAYAINARELVPVGDIEPSAARSLTKAACSTALVSIALKQDSVNGKSRLVYETDEEIPSGDYCLLGGAKPHELSFVWGSPMDKPRTLVREKKCLREISNAAEDLTGRKAAACSILGGYGTGRIELVDFAQSSEKSPLASLMIIRHSLVDDTQIYSQATFPANSAVWTAEHDGNFRPERFRHLFTVSLSPDPNNGDWFTAIEWDGPKGTDLVLYEPVGDVLKPIVANHDRATHKVEDADIAFK
jgi:hypothetical protein